MRQRNYGRDRDWNKAPGLHCGECLDLSHRRPKRGCPECGEPYQDEDLAEVFQEVRERRRFYG